jgi:hypothetical protein
MTEYSLSLRKIECHKTALRRAQGPAKTKVIEPVETPKEF